MEQTTLQNSILFYAIIWAVWTVLCEQLFWLPNNQTLPENTTATFSCIPSSNHPIDVPWSVYFPDL